jgi:Fe2+ or Zn2+ uptake regulation protein
MTDLQAALSSIEEMGYRLTPPRLAVVAAVAARNAPFTIEDISQSLPDVGRATVFRTVKLLLEIDFVCRVLLDDGATRYRVSRRGHHHHLICTRCGAVQDFTECGVGDLAALLGARTEYEIEGHRLEVYGRCSECRGSPSARQPVSISAS